MYLRGGGKQPSLGLEPVPRPPPNGWLYRSVSTLARRAPGSSARRAPCWSDRRREPASEYAFDGPGVWIVSGSYFSPNRLGL